MVHDDRCKTPLHHVRKQERLEQMKLVLQKQLERPTQNSWDAPLKTVGTPHSKQMGRSTKNQKPDQSQMSVFALYCENHSLDRINQKLHLALIIGFAKTVRPHNNLLLTGFIKTFIRRNKIYLIYASSVLKFVPRSCQIYG